MTGETAAEAAVPCSCSHPKLVHHRTPSGIRTWCTHGDAAGMCRCQAFTPATEEP